MRGRRRARRRPRCPERCTTGRACAARAARQRACERAAAVGVERVVCELELGEPPAAEPSRRSARSARQSVGGGARERARAQPRHLERADAADRLRQLAATAASASPAQVEAAQFLAVAVRR